MVDSYTGSNLQYFWEKILVDIAHQIIGENIKFETWLWSSILVKKTLLLDMFWKLSFTLKVSEIVLQEISVL